MTLENEYFIFTEDEWKNEIFSFMKLNTKFYHIPKFLFHFSVITEWITTKQEMKNWLTKCPHPELPHLKYSIQKEIGLVYQEP